MQASVFSCISKYHLSIPIAKLNRMDYRDKNDLACIGPVPQLFVCSFVMRRSMMHVFSFVLLFLELIGPIENRTEREEDTGKGICKYRIFRCCRLI